MPAARRKAQSMAADVTAPPSPNRLMDIRHLSPSDAVDRRQVAVNRAESPLAWLVRRGLVNASQFAASEALRDDFMRAGHLPSVTMRWDAAPSARGGSAAPPAHDPSTARLSARQRFDAAIAAAGPGLADILWRVVCMGEGLETAERALAWPARTGKIVLCLALDRVAGFYRL